jgi:hypothetical protein
MVALLIVFAAAGCGTSKSDLEKEYQRGYEDGVKAEQAKWSSEKLKLAQTMIKEQEDSQENINRLIKGEVASVTINTVNLQGDAASVDITVQFKDGTILKGKIDLKKVEGKWYMEKVTRASQ